MTDPQTIAQTLRRRALRKWPWLPDDYEQARQAFVSWSRVNGGDWLHPRSPLGEAAGKPPLLWRRGT